MRLQVKGVRKRRILKYSAMSFTAVVVVLVLLVGVFAALPPKHVTEDAAFQNPLPVPPLLEPHKDQSASSDGSRFDLFDREPDPGEAAPLPSLAVREGSQEFYPGTPSRTIGINGDYLGPTVRLRTGEDAQFQISNELDEPTTIHWHGMKLPQTMDGGPLTPIQAGETQHVHWQVRNQAASLWYHTHPHGATADQVYRGAAGMVIVEDSQSGSLGLPSEYGTTDLPVIVQDRTFDADGRLVPNPNRSGLRIGDTLVVNGEVFPYAEVPCEPIRLRLLNASNAHRFDFGFDDDRRFHLVASDGGLLERAVQVGHVLLAPGERAEIVVDPSPCDTLRLMSLPVVEDSVVHRGVQRLFGFGGDQDRLLDVLELRPADGSGQPWVVPERLNVIDRGIEADAVSQRVFRLDDDRTINRVRFDMDRVDFEVEAGTTEIWEIRNPGFTYHPFHVHGVQFLVLDRDDEPPSAHETGWKDTVLLGRGEVVRILVEFEPYTDTKTPYVFHCHILEHEDKGMMGTFLVT